MTSPDRVNKQGHGAATVHSGGGPQGVWWRVRAPTLSGPPKPYETFCFPTQMLFLSTKFDIFVTVLQGFLVEIHVSWKSWDLEWAGQLFPCASFFRADFSSLLN